MVQAWSQSNQTGGQAKTDESGCYEISGLDPLITDYQIIVRGGDGFMPAFYSDNSDDDSTNDTVYDIEGVLGISPSEQDRNLILKQGYTISGLLTHDDKPVGNIHIEAWSEETETWAETWSSENLVDGKNFELMALPSGTYEIEILSDSYTARPFEITLDDASISNVMIELIQFSARTISGKVINLAQNESVEIEASSFSQNFAKSIELVGTGTDLTYTISGLMPAYDYILEITPENAPYQLYPNAYDWEGAQPVDISNQNQSDIDFELNNDTTSISGHIQFPESATANHMVSIEAFSLQMGFWKSIDIQIANNPTYYELSGLPKASDYYVMIDSDTFQTMFYHQTNDMDEAVMIDTTDTIADTSIDFTLISGVSISGKIQLPTGKIIVDAEIEAWSEQTNAWSFTQSDETGSFTLNGLTQSKDFIIHAWHEEYGHFYYHPNKVLRDDGKASVVSTVDGSASDIIIFAESGKIIQGQVTDTSGKGIANVWVDAWSDSLDSGNSAFTGSDGYFEINGLIEARDYQIRVEPDWFSEYLSATLSNIATDTRNLKLILKKGQRFTIQGLVLGLSEEPVANADIELWSVSNASAYGWDRTNHLGFYEIKGLMTADDYVLIVIPLKHPQLASYSEPQLTVLSNMEKNIHLATAYKISGKVVTQKSGTPVRNSWITAFSEQTNFWGETKTASDGTNLETIHANEILSVNIDGMVSFRTHHFSTFGVGFITQEQPDNEKDEQSGCFIERLLF